MFPATIGAHWTVTKSARRTPVDFIARQYNYFACCSRPPFDRGRGKRDVGKTLNKGGREKERKKKRERERERERVEKAGVCHARWPTMSRELGPFVCQTIGAAAKTTRNNRPLFRIGRGYREEKGKGRRRRRRRQVFRGWWSDSEKKKERKEACL